MNLGSYELVVPCIRVCSDDKVIVQCCKLISILRLKSDMLLLPWQVLRAFETGLIYSNMHTYQQVLHAKTGLAMSMKQTSTKAITNFIYSIGNGLCGRLGEWAYF